VNGGTALGRRISPTVVHDWTWHVGRSSGLCWRLSSIRVVAIALCLSHACTVAMSAFWATA
jgi:hypothetical protein